MKRIVVAATAPLIVVAIVLASGDTSPESTTEANADRGNVPQIERPGQATETPTRSFGRLATDFHPDTSPEYMQAINRLLEQRFVGGRNAKPFDGNDGLAFTAFSRWPGNLGEPIELTWSLVPDGTPWDVTPSNLFARLDNQYAGGGGRAAWVQRFVLGFQRWEDLTGVKFTRIVVANDADDGEPWNTPGEPGLRGDIRIGMIPIDAGGAGLLAFAVLPGTGLPSIGDDGDVVFDSNEDWFNQPWNPTQGFNRTITHEIGHALGLEHVCPLDQSKLMESSAQPGLTAYGPQHDDLRGGQMLYGDPFEPNESTASPAYLAIPPAVFGFNIGAIVNPYGIPPGSFGPFPISSGRLSIHSPSDVDVYAVGFPHATCMQVTLDPVGRQYQEAPQSCGGFCCTNTTTFSHLIVDLRLELLDRTGAVLATAFTSNGNWTSVSWPLTIVNAPYHVRVTPTSGNFVEPQTYDLIFDADPGCGGEQCDDGDWCNGVEIGSGNGDCVVYYPGGDCNANFIDDLCDIGLGNSMDCNDNGIPDECEQDCNGNGIHDSCDISSGFSTDCDGNGVPDECEQDCNGNGVVDACDISSGSSWDDNDNGVPDECESTLVVPTQFPTIQAAVDAAENGDTIYVLPGTYTGAGNRNVTISDITLQILARSCPDDTIIDLQGQGRAFFVGSQSQPNRTRIEGFTIANGNAAQAPVGTDSGGAVYCWGADMILDKCVFKNNAASWVGGAVLIRNDGGTGLPVPWVLNCLFYDNSAAYGGAAYVMRSVTPNFIGCTFTENTAAFAGGAVASEGDNDSAAIVSSIVWRNAPLQDQLAPGGMNFAVIYTDLPPAEIGDFPSDVGNISTDPDFVDAPGNDFHIEYGSACRNSGHPNYPLNIADEDVDCESRVQQGLADMGADERGPFQGAIR